MQEKKIEESRDSFQCVVVTFLRAIYSNNIVYFLDVLPLDGTPNNYGSRVRSIVTFSQVTGMQVITSKRLHHRLYVISYS